MGDIDVIYRPEKFPAEGLLKHLALFWCARTIAAKMMFL